MGLNAFETRVRVSSVNLYMHSLCGIDIGAGLTGIVNSKQQIQICKVVWVCGEEKVIVYLSLVHWVVTYMYNWSRVSLGGPY